MKAKKILIICFCIAFVVMTIESAIIAMDYLHTEQCEMPDCPLCRLITLAIDFIKDISFISITILSFVLIIPLIRILNNSVFEVAKRLTLVEMKVIQNN